MIETRPEVPGDYPLVREVHRLAFGREDESEFADRLRGSCDPQISLVATLDEQVVGHVLFSPVRVEKAPDEFAACGLAPVGVLPRFQKRGVGSALIRRGLGMCAAARWSAVFLVGAPRYYSRFGFVLAAPLGFRYNDLQDPVLQVRELSVGALSRCCGLISGAL